MTPVSIQIDATTARAIAEFDKLKKSLSTVSGAMDVVKGVAASIGVALSASAFGGWIKGAIDAADEMGKLSQKSGIAVKDVGGLQLAFQQSGLSAEALQANMSRLNKGIADGNDAFAAMGVSTRNADGSLKSTRQMLGEVADKFQSFPDGPAKAALAMELFGKSGADMLPLLNGGSAALDEFDAMARKLGLTMDEETTKNAEAFNDTLDLVSMGSQGVARQIAAQLLPTLSGLAGQFLESMTSGDKLTKTAEFLSTGLKGLYVVGLGVVEIFSTVGKTLGGVAAAIVAAVSGDFQGAGNILREMKSDIGTGWKDTLAQMQNAWSATGNSAVEAMSKTQKGIVPTVKDTKAAADETKKLADEYQKLIDKIYGKDAGTEPDFLKNLKLLEAQGKKTGKTLEQIRKDQEAYIKQQPYMLAAEKTRIQAAERANQVWDDQFELQEKIRLQNENGIRTAREVVEQMEFETKTLRLTNTEREIAIRLRQVELAGLKAGTPEYEAMAERIRQAVIGRDLVQGSIDTQKAIRDEWVKTSDQIAQSFTDALMQGGQSVAGYLKSLFRTLVLRPILMPVSKAVTGFAGSLMGMDPAMAGGGAGDGLASNLLSSGLSSVTGFGSGFMSGLSEMMMGSSFVGPSASMATGATGMGASMAGAIPYVAVAALVANALGLFRKTKKVGQGLTGTLGAGDIEGYDLMRRSGTLFGGPDYSLRNTGVAEQSGAIQDAYNAMRENTAAMIERLGGSGQAVRDYTTTLGNEVLHNDTGGIGIKLTGLSPEEAAAKVQAALEVANEELAALALGATNFARDGETAVQTLQRLTAIQGMSEALNPMGGIFSSIANASVEARQSLIELAGGIDTLVGQANAFVKDYYSQDEQAGMQARAITDALAAVGLDASMLQERADFRTMIESLDPETQQQQLVAMLQLGPSFAQLSDYMKANNLTIEEALKNAPDVPILQSMLNPQQATADATQAMTGQLAGIAGQLTGIQQAADAAADAAAAAASAASQAAGAAGAAAGAASSAAASADLAASRPIYDYDLGRA